MSVTINNTGGQVLDCSGGTGAITLNVVAISRLRYVGGTTSAASDECKVTDTAGNVLFDTFSTGADYTDEVEMSKVPPVLGLKIATLTGNRGHVKVYLR